MVMGKNKKRDGIMDKLTPQHVCAYLEHKPIFVFKELGNTLIRHYVINYHPEGGMMIVGTVNGTKAVTGGLEKWKLVLRPLEHITKRYADKYDCTVLELIYHIKRRTISVEAWNELLADHYDVYGLIDHNLAIATKTD